MAEEQYIGTVHAQQAKKATKEKYDLVAEYPVKKVTRRSFLMSWAGMSWMTFSAATGAGGLACLRFMLPNVLFEPPQVFKAGKLPDYVWDKPDERFKLSHKTWIVKLQKDWDNGRHMFALNTTCTHLGCMPNVLFNESKIKCPCHGSGFRYTGVNFEGPAPRPLERYKIFMDPIDGQVVVDKTKVFQQEKGQWKDPESYLDLSTA